jgi:bacillithiol biosynthesis cysteine-adding enzyme BshC
MESHCLSFRDIPNTTQIFLSFLEDFGSVAPFYAHPPNEAGVEAASRDVYLNPSVRESVVEILREQNRDLAGGSLDRETARNLDRLAAGAFAIVTGQQVGLFSGPAYSLYKSIAVVHRAAELTEHGVETVPIFWLATEDHDLAEVNHSFWNTRNGLVRYDLSPAVENESRRVGEVVLGNDVRVLAAKAAGSLEGPFAEEVARALVESYAPEETYGSAFGKLMSRLLTGRGVIFLNPLDARLHRLAAPTYLRAIEEMDALREALLARSKDLGQRGLHVQVRVTNETTLLFLNVNGRRVPLRERGGKFVAGKITFTPGELRTLLADTPEAFTANVLLRPVVQDTLLPTAAYIGGPAEIAYMAQAEIVYKRILGRMPAILPRPSATLVEPSVARLLAKYGIDFRDILRGRRNLRGKMEAASLPRSLTRRFTSDEKALRRLLRGYQKPLERLDSTLLGALQSSERKMLHQLLKLKGKASRAEGLRTGVLDRHERILLDSIYPQRGLQERSLCSLPFLATYGPELFDAMERSMPPLGEAESSPCGHKHNILYL